MADPIIIAVPKGRILAEAVPLLERAGIVPEAAFRDEDSRALRFSTNNPGIDLIRVRAFDVATFVAHGAAQLGIVGSDVLAEFDYSELYAPVDLGIGHCRLAVAEPRGLVESDDPARWSHIRIATKYPGITRAHFAARGVQAECIKLSGAMELAPSLGLSAFFSYGLADRALSWQKALTVSLVCGLMSSAFALLRVSRLVVLLLPTSIKWAIVAGMGLLPVCPDTTP